MDESDARGRTREELKDVARRWMTCGWSGTVGLERERFLALHAVDFVDHSAVGRLADREAFFHGVEQLYAAFPDFAAQTDDLVIDPDRGMVAIRWSARGTHRGSFAGIDPTGRPVHFTGIEIIHIERGLVRARWGEWNGMEILAQMRQA